MSRYVLRNDAYFEVTVGYDDPMDTFFSQVFDIAAGNRKGDDVLVVWKGIEPQELTSADECLATVAEYVKVPEGFREQLESDRANRKEPPEFYRRASKEITGIELP